MPPEAKQGAGHLAAPHQQDACVRAAFSTLTRPGLGQSRCGKPTAGARPSRSPGFGRLTPTTGRRVPARSVNASLATIGVQAALSRSLQHVRSELRALAAALPPITQGDSHSQAHARVRSTQRLRRPHTASQVLVRQTQARSAVGSRFRSVTRRMSARARLQSKEGLTSRSRFRSVEPNPKGGLRSFAHTLKRSRPS